jgi:alanine racemase
MILFSSLESICEGRVLRLPRDREVTTLLSDSRKTVPPEGAVFFAIAGERHDGHRFLGALHAAGVRQFVVERAVDPEAFPESNILRVDSSVAALQALARYHRQQFSIPVIGVTGSNGKTIVKEWLFQLLSADYNVVKNPGSYNSQIGVALSVWQMHRHHQLGIFEAGISKPGEMERLERMIQPSLVILTTIGSAHDEGFSSRAQKIKEKLKLARHAKLILYCRDQQDVTREISTAKQVSQRLFCWGADAECDVRIEKQSDNNVLVSYRGQQVLIELPFSNVASLENAGHCIATMLYLGCSADVVASRIRQLQSVPMRLELKQGINQCQLIDDTYNNDLGGLQISLDFLSGLQGKKRSVILSDILQSGLSDEILGREIAGRITQAGVSSFIGIGRILFSQQAALEKIARKFFFRTTDEFLKEADWGMFQQEAILVKGARSFQFERIVQRLQAKIHGTVMEIDLAAIVHNLNFFKSKLFPGVKLMVMVKAFAYGSGSEEVAHLLQYHNVDYLGVAYSDEGVQLRRAQIRLPIMVMNPSEKNFESLIAYALEPEIYSLAILRALVLFLEGRRCKIHLKIDSGMHRLGFEEAELTEVIAILQENPAIEVISVFSHLAGADEPEHDDFTNEQAQRFARAISRLRSELDINPVAHLLNSSGILRFPTWQFGMVRLGIGLYGIDPTRSGRKFLQPAMTLKTVISQIRRVPAGATVGYGRKGRTNRPTTIATIAIGYADGFSRRFSGGVGSVLLHGALAPVIGNVCMDMTMVDITGIEAKEGDEVVIFGKELPIEVLAEKINTIPYELLTATSERVKRVFYAESI